MYPLTRLQGILFNPGQEWERIRDDKITNVQVFLKYVIWVAALPSIGYLISVAKYENFLINLRAAILSYVIALVSVDLSAYLIHLSAPKFEAQKDVGRALKLVAFGATPVFVAGALNFIPIAGGILWLIGAAYCAFLFYLGLPLLLATPLYKLVPFLATAFVIFIGAYLVLLVVGGIVFEVRLIEIFTAAILF
ncbi:MAG: YIP1 family protein [bacterium]